MRDATLDRVATRYRRDVIGRESRNVEPAEANQAARRALEDQPELERLTPCKSLLAGLKKRIQEEYGVSFGNQAIVHEIANEEWDQELLDMVDEIERLAAS